MTLSQLRHKYLDFFASPPRSHAVIPSAPLVPENDPTTLFTSSGMQPLVPYLLGQPHPKGTRLTNSQKSFRSQDIEEVGDNRHTTFFEMLGNWSLGSYFKADQLSWFFEFLTQEIGLDPAKIYVTVFRGNEQLSIPRDTESVKIWQALFKTAGIEALDIDLAEVKGLQNGRIFYYDEKKNWWSRSGVPSAMPAGEPGGPDSEVFYDFGTELQLHEQSKFKDLPCHVNCDCGRFLEIGNSVFMQYQKSSDPANGGAGGSFKELPQKNVDFGGGMERILAASSNERDIFKTNAFELLIAQIEKLSGQQYETNQNSFRVIADHVKAATMLAADGVYPSNKEQGYFSRRLLRRAIRHGKLLGINQAFLSELVPLVAEMYGDTYPEVKDQAAKIKSVFADEETKFSRTLEKGLKEFDKLVAGQDSLTAVLAFQLYETFGFPIELSIEEAQQRQLKVPADIETQFSQLKHQHAASSRTASVGMFKGGLADHSEVVTKYHTATHLLHAALRKLLGDEVKQKGSNITEERLRFDFSFSRALTDQEKIQVEQQINAWITADLPVTKQVMSKTEALKSGAVAFFIEKYPDEVTVYTIGSDAEKDWVSKELCGGPHVTHTGEIGLLKLAKEQAVGAGVRRIYAQIKGIAI